MEWLGKVESYLTEDQPTLGDLDTVSMLLEQHKVLTTFLLLCLVARDSYKAY